MTAVVQGTGFTTVFSGSAIYSYATHVDPLWSAASCTNCQVGAGTSGLTLGGTSTQNYFALVNVTPVCDGTLSSSFRRVSNAGGVNAADIFSVLLRLADPALTDVGTCGSHADVLSASQLAITRAWIRNSAPNN